MKQQRVPRSCCVFRKCGYISPENGSIGPFLVHYGIRQRGTLVKGRALHNHRTRVCVCVCVCVRKQEGEHNPNNPL